MEKRTTQAQKKATKKYQNSNDRMEAVFPSGTKQRIVNLGYKPATFIKNIVLNELDKMEKLNNN